MWPIRLVAVSVDEIIEHIRDESYGANLSPKEVVSTFIHLGRTVAMISEGCALPPKNAFSDILVQYDG